jgi:hypothetical protein
VRAKLREQRDRYESIESRARHAVRETLAVNEALRAEVERVEAYLAGRR